MPYHLSEARTRRGERDHLRSGHRPGQPPALGVPERAEDNARFFTAVLPGRDAPLGSPGGAELIGAIGTDTELVNRQDATT
ncbi:hypothetical protein [Pseudonocardia nigra]|uniref:hypothetical protein n=1 Tax=Pseudonocardia nigra TaxID=1921578 RepID=UPI0027E31DB9|nr:hypothetical protein [Pseudonocardia nigra]